MVAEKSVGCLGNRRRRASESQMERERKTGGSLLGRNLFSEQIARLDAWYNDRNSFGQVAGSATKDPHAQDENHRRAESEIRGELVPFVVWLDGWRSDWAAWEISLPCLSLQRSVSGAWPRLATLRLPIGSSTSRSKGDDAHHEVSYTRGCRRSSHRRKRAAHYTAARTMDVLEIRSPMSFATLPTSPLHTQRRRIFWDGICFLIDTVDLSLS